MAYPDNPEVASSYSFQIYDFHSYIITQSVNVPSVIHLNVILLNVVAPFQTRNRLKKMKSKIFFGLDGILPTFKIGTNFKPWDYIFKLFTVAITFVLQ